MIIDIWAVHEGDDDRSSGYPAFFYTNHAEAVAKAKGSGWYGGDAPLKKRHAIFVEGKYYLLDEIGEIDLDQKAGIHRKKLRQQAKAKLTQAELEALGIDEE